MTDRDYPADTTRPPIPLRTATVGDRKPNAQLEPAQRGDAAAMSVTTAPRLQPRPPISDHSPADPVRNLLGRLFAGHSLPSFTPADLAATCERTPLELDVAARAATCPDLFVIHAPDVAVGERIIADVAHLASDRVLILSPDPAAADRIAERLAKAGVTVVRALADDENPLRPSPVVARLTSVALGADRVAQLRREATAALAAAEARAAEQARFAELTARLLALDGELVSLHERRNQTETEIRRQVAVEGTATALAEAVTRCGAACATADTARKALADKVAALRHDHAESLRKPGFFTRLFSKPKAATDPTVLEQQLHAAERDLVEADGRCEAARAELKAAEAALQAEREAAVQERLGSKRAALDLALATAEAERARVRTERDALEHVDAQAGPLVLHDVAAAQERLSDIGRTASELIRQYLAEPRVVVGTPGSLAADAVFANQGGGNEPAFGLLVFDRAEELTEQDFHHLAGLANRWLLVGHAAPIEEPKPYLNGSHRNGSSRNGRPMDLSFAARLARVLDRETWATEADRLLCRLAHPTQEQRRRMVREPLLDRPDIELRFVSPADGEAEPVLAEVVFPPHTTVAAAKGFLFQQLGEVLPRPCGAVNWQHDNTITACWPVAEHGAGVHEVAWVELEAGVREKVVGCGATSFTAAITFDPAHGWDADKAAAWLAVHLSTNVCSRFAALVRKS